MVTCHGESGEEKQEWLQSFRTEEAYRREEWEIAHRVWRATGGKERGKDYKPWPFDQPNAEKQVDEYIRAAFGVIVLRQSNCLLEHVGELNLFLAVCEPVGVGRNDYARQNAKKAECSPQPNPAEGIVAFA